MFSGIVFAVVSGGCQVVAAGCLGEVFADFCRDPEGSGNLYFQRGMKVSQRYPAETGVWNCAGECGLSAASASSLSPSAVFLEHEGWLRTVVSSRLGETDAVDDVMQNIAMAVVRQKSALSGVQRVGAWLYRIAVRQVLMYRRATGRRRKLLQRVQSDAVSAVDVAGPLGVMLHDETQESVRRALGQLGELDRQLLLLKYAEGWSYRQIAERLGVQEDTVEYRLLKARRTLRRQLSALNVEGVET